MSVNALATTLAVGVGMRSMDEEELAADAIVSIAAAERADTTLADIMIVGS
jgi:hypothetical protein